LKLTQRAIDALTLPFGKTEQIEFDEALPGFGIRIRAGGSRTYIANYKIGGKQRRITLGTTEQLRAEQARAKATELLLKARSGQDPAAERIEARQRAGETFAIVVRRFLVRQKARLRPGSYVAQERALLNHFGVLHGMAMTLINKRMIAARLSELATNNGPTAADQARVHLSTFFVWAMREGLVEANPVAATNTHGAGKARDRVLGDAEIAAVWHAAGDGFYGALIKLLILTGQRRTEIGSLQWDEVDLASRLIRLPGERTKNGLPHDVPLSEPAMRILQEMPRQGPFVCGTASIGFSDYSAAKRALDARIAAARGEPPTHWVLHDLRRSVATHMAERLGVQPHIIEAVLNHISGHRAGVAGIYNRAT
jgi:integrase